jgi:hypothetical protein
VNHYVRPTVRGWNLLLPFPFAPHYPYVLMWTHLILILVDTHISIFTTNNKVNVAATMVEQQLTFKYTWNKCEVSIHSSREKGEGVSHNYLHTYIGTYIHTFSRMIFYVSSKWREFLKTITWFVVICTEFLAETELKNRLQDYVPRYIYSAQFPV